MSKLGKLPTSIELDEDFFENEKKISYESSKANKNNLSYWFPRIANCGIKVPETLIIPINFAQFKWLIGDKYSESDIISLGKFILSKIEKSNLRDKKKIFIKTGTFSNKFNFSTCSVDDFTKLGSKFLSIAYDSMCVGAGEASEIIVREFIESCPELPTIYNGLPLKTEFRVFYDFDKNKVLGVFNYWDKDTILNGLENSMYKEDLSTFKEFYDTLESSYSKHKESVVDLVDSAMSNVDLTGAWSVDIMLANGEFYLIDMATASTSYYYDKLQDK